MGSRTPRCGGGIKEMLFSITIKRLSRAGEVAVCVPHPTFLPIHTFVSFQAVVTPHSQQLVWLPLSLALHSASARCTLWHPVPCMQSLRHSSPTVELLHDR